MDNQTLEVINKLMGQIADIQSGMVEMKTEMKYITHKINTLDRELFMRTLETPDERLSAIEELTRKIAKQDIEFLGHKIQELEEGIFALNNDK